MLRSLAWLSADVHVAKASATMILSDPITKFETPWLSHSAINPGNSGGALVDVTGRLVGINTAIF